MVHWTEKQYLEYMVKLKGLDKGLQKGLSYPEEEALERDLAGKIMQYCKEHGFPCQ